MYSEPCAKLTMRVTPKISVSPPQRETAPTTTRGRSAAGSSATRASRSHQLRPKEALFGGTDLADRVVVRQIVFAVGIFPVDHHALAILDRRAPDERAHRRLVIDRAKRDPPEWNVDFEIFHRSDELLGIGRSRLGNRRCRSLDRTVTNDRSKPRIITVLRLIGIAKSLVRGRVDCVPRIAGDVPADRRLVL